MIDAILTGIIKNKLRENFIFFPEDFRIKKCGYKLGGLEIADLQS
jgi:hypothetical protein